MGLFGWLELGAVFTALYVLHSAYRKRMNSLR